MPGYVPQQRHLPRRSAPHFGADGSSGYCRRDGADRDRLEADPLRPDPHRHRPPSDPLRSRAGTVRNRPYPELPGQGHVYGSGRGDLERRNAGPLRDLLRDPDLLRPGAHRLPHRGDRRQRLPSERQGDQAPRRQPSRHQPDERLFSEPCGDRPRPAPVQGIQYRHRPYLPLSPGPPASGAGGRVRHLSDRRERSGDPRRLGRQAPAELRPHLRRSPLGAALSRPDYLPLPPRQDPFQHRNHPLVPRQRGRRIPQHGFDVRLSQGQLPPARPL